MKAFLLAAGIGKRLRPLTLSTPKPLISVDGVPLIVRHIEQLKVAGIREFVINTHWQADQLTKLLGDGSAYGVQINWSHENELLETGGALRRALPILGSEPFVLVSADIWTDFNFTRLLESPMQSGRVARLVLVDNPEHHSQGDLSLDITESERRFSPVRIASGRMQTLTYSGIALLRPEWVSAWQIDEEVFPLRRPLFEAVERGQVEAMHYQGIWSDIGTPERLQSIRNLLEVE